MDKVNRPNKPKKEDLINLYDICNKIFKKGECFYTKDEFKEIKKDTNSLNFKFKLLISIIYFFLIEG